MRLSRFVLLCIMAFSLMLLPAYPFSTYALEFAHKTMWGEKGVAEGQFNQVSGGGN